MARWTAFPYAGQYDFDAASVRKRWARLHVGDAEPLPRETRLLEAWALFHNGEFQRAVDAGLALGASGITLANKAACIYATYLEKKEQARLALYLDVARRAEAQAAQDPLNPNAFYWQAYALGRYSQGISVAKALAQGLGGKVKSALENTIKLQPSHADAHIALGAFHADVIDKVGALIGGMTYGARKDTGLQLFQQALRINFESAIALVEYANAMLMLEGDQKLGEATKLYQQAATFKPIDAAERLEVELAKAELQD
jgi:tetratricopeptide (TPR) repeat protein